MTSDIIHSLTLKVGKTPTGLPCVENTPELEVFKQACAISKLDFKIELAKKLSHAFGKTITEFAIQQERSR